MPMAYRRSLPSRRYFRRQTGVPAGVTNRYMPPPSESLVIAALPALLLETKDRIFTSVSLLIARLLIPPSMHYLPVDTPCDTPRGFGCRWTSPDATAL